MKTLTVVKTYKLTYATLNYDYEIREYATGKYRYLIEGRLSKTYDYLDSCKIQAIAKIWELNSPR